MNLKDFTALTAHNIGRALQSKTNKPTKDYDLALCEQLVKEIVEAATQLQLEEKRDTMT